MAIRCRGRCAGAPCVRCYQYAEIGIVHSVRASCSSILLVDNTHTYTAAACTSRYTTGTAAHTVLNEAGMPTCNKCNKCRHDVSEAHLDHTAVLEYVAMCDVNAFFAHSEHVSSCS
jgi:hypothetical protein